ncbi:YgcG family protein [Paralcaligenes sp. KSB-10]|uniref:TPM domain-containing protein n=1 Tax=Paralcaligenes sp. KSB-10 TaxID=2901142 RepID=UPI001E39D233|nr:YgcG family protein [Paralcaligenes sp. KSB-10]UHL63383.1 YgcG family protein [Paralcaligenes sp. KSB-10]
MNIAMPATISWKRAGAMLACCVLYLACLAPWARAAEAPVPSLTARVTDLTKTLDAATQASLTQKLAALEESKGAQIAVLIVPTTGDSSIEQYATHVFDQWKLGRKKVDDGILFVVAKNDHRLRIEVGYGLEGAVTDLQAGRIIREQVTPLFKQGDYAGGVTAGVDSLIKLVKGEALPPPSPQYKSEQAGGDSPPVHMLLPLIFMAFVLPATIAAFAAALFVYLMFHSLGYALLGAVAALVLSGVGRAIGAGGRGSSARASRTGGVIGGLGGLGGFGGGGFGGGGGGGFGGGGFGGGGGGSGGGGASGGW